MSNAIFPLAAPVNEPVRSYAPGSPEKKSLKKRLDEMLAERDRDPAHHRRQGGAHRRHRQGRLPARPQARARHLPPGRRRGGGGGRRGREGGLAGVVRDRLGGAGRGAAPGRRPARRPLARHGQRRHHARPVEDGLPGRDRLRLRADRLLALQPLLHAAALRRAAVVARPGSGTASSTGRSRGSSSPSRRSTSPRSAATCRPRRR